MTTPNLRRFTDLPEPVPAAVKALAADHPAVVEGRTIFPSTVADPTDAPRLLVSGHNNRKIGRIVAKGPWEGMPIFTLTLEERATCPSECHMYRACYGNAMPFARRHRHGPELEKRLELEVETLSIEYPKGFVVRLHVLGDFYSVEYAALWWQLLEKHAALHIYGYTARSVSQGEIGADITETIHDMNSKFPTRCFIRYSRPKPQPFGAIVLDRSDYVKQGDDIIICPAEISATECCATCGLCWSEAMRKKTIGFLKHGLGSNETAAKVEQVNAPEAKPKAGDKYRKIKTLIFSNGKQAQRGADPPQVMNINPRELWVDERYQRSISRKGVRLIRSIVEGWDWRRFKPPIVTEDENGRLTVIDGQHTAIAAASIDWLKEIPVLKVRSGGVEQSAAAFVSHNRNRVNLTPMQIYYAEIAAGDPLTLKVKSACDKADIIVLKLPPQNSDYGPGETVAVGTLKWLVKKHGDVFAHRVLGIVSELCLAPIKELHLRATAYVCSTSKLPDQEIIRRWRTIKDPILAATEASEEAEPLWLALGRSLAKDEAMVA
jgi:hypothetical protein